MEFSVGPWPLETGLRPAADFHPKKQARIRRSQLEIHEKERRVRSTKLTQEILAPRPAAIKS